MKSSTVVTFCVLAFIVGVLGIIVSFATFYCERRGEILCAFTALGSSLMICCSAIAASIASRANKSEGKLSD